MLADFAEVGTADFSEICLLVSVAGAARAKPYLPRGSHWPPQFQKSSVIVPDHFLTGNGRQGSVDFQIYGIADKSR